MAGYKSERYLFFGKACARLDDLANLIPSRLTALLICLAAPVFKQDCANAFFIWRRDGRKHASPNAGQPEAAMAGALGLRLAGPVSHAGKPAAKPFIGDSLREITARDIYRANQLMAGASTCCLILALALRAVL
jgi:adenosylcobinamide-phosphate synthase